MCLEYESKISTIPSNYTWSGIEYLRRVSRDQCVGAPQQIAALRYGQPPHDGGGIQHGCPRDSRKYSDPTCVPDLYGTRTHACVAR